MTPGFWRPLAVLAALLSCCAAALAQTQRSGEAYSTVPTVVREAYDMGAFTTPLPLTETELKGRALFAQRCANCHGGNPPRNPGPLLGRETVEKRGEVFLREKVRTGTPGVMPGFEFSLEPAQIDQIIAFLKTYAPRRSQGAD